MMVPTLLRGSTEDQQTRPVARAHWLQRDERRVKGKIELGELHQDGGEEARGAGGVCVNAASRSSVPG